MEIIQKPTIDLSLIKLNIKDINYPKIDKCDSFSSNNSEKFYSELEVKDRKKKRVEGDEKK